MMAASFYTEVPVCGSAGRYIFPAAGVVQGASAFIEESEEFPIRIVAEAHQMDGTTSIFNFTIGKRGGSTQLNLPVDAGTRLYLRSEGAVRGVFVGLLWQLR